MQVALCDALERERLAAERLGAADVQLAQLGEMAERHAARQRALCLLVRLREEQLRAAGAPLPPALAAASAAARLPAAGGGAGAGGGAAAGATDGGASAPDDGTPPAPELALAALQHAYDHHPDVVRLALEREELAGALAALSGTPDEGEAVLAKLRRDVSGLKKELLFQVRQTIALREQVAVLQGDGADGARAGGGVAEQSGENRALRAALAASEAALGGARAEQEAALQAMAAEHERDVIALMAGLAEAEERATKAEARRVRTQAEMEAIVDEYEQMCVAMRSARGGVCCLPPLPLKSPHTAIPSQCPTPALLHGCRV